MRPPVLCEGAPRDLGQDQGVIGRPAIRDWAARNGASGRPSLWASLKPLTSGPVLGQGVGREVLRHHPHAAERMDGIARGAGISLSTLMELSIAAGASRSSAPAHELPALGALFAGGGPASGLVRSLPAHASPGCRWIVRRSVPEIGFASLEVTLPWLTSAVAGVNEKGLAVAIVSESGERPGIPPGPPPHLLVQDCLQRFVDLESALQWCAARPAGPGASILFGDESGDGAALVLRSGGQLVLRSGTDGPESIVRGGDSATSSELHKRLEAGDNPFDSLLEVACAGGAAAVYLEPLERRLSFELGSGERLVASAVRPSGRAGEQRVGTSRETS